MRKNTKTSKKGGFLIRNSLVRNRNLLFTIILFFNVPLVHSQDWLTDLLNQCPKQSIFLPGPIGCDNNPYHLIFEDNFDGETLDLNKWRLQEWSQGSLYGGSSEQYYTLDNIEVSNGTCKIITKEETVEELAVFWMDPDEVLADGFPNLRTYQYTSSSIWTKQSFFYGKYEIRCRVPEGQGFWPAFWTYGNEQNKMSEIDIFEIYGHNIDRWTSNVYYDEDQDGSAHSCPYAHDNLFDFSEWHIFTCIFEPDKITWQIDGITVRVYYRFITWGGQPISCGENIAYGTYAQQVIYPTEPMNIIVNTAVQTGSNAPNESTSFPGVFEIDYIRYFKKSEHPPCEGCLNHMSYENTNQLPVITRVNDYIIGGNNVIVQNGQLVQFKAGNEINLLPGFSAEPESNFSALIENCGLNNYEDVSIDYSGNNALEEIYISKCLDPIYSVEAVGCTHYWYMYLKFPNEYWGFGAGSCVSNHINLWNSEFVDEGVYYTILILFNCSETKSYEDVVIVTDCRSMNASSTDFANHIEHVDSNDFKSLSQNPKIKTNKVEDKQSNVVIYPNPAKNELFVQFPMDMTSVSSISINDLRGSELHFEQITEIGGSNSPHRIDLNEYANGIYIVKITYGSNLYVNKIVISQ